MSLRLTIENVQAFGPDIWGAHLTGAEVRRLGEPKVRGGRRSIISVTDARFAQEARLLSFSPEHAAVLNIGSSDNALIIDIGNDASAEIESPHTKNNAPRPEPLGSGDAAFLAECRRLFLNPSLVKMGTGLLQEVRKRYPGKMVEGKARKWVNHPANFLALTIQNRDQSFAIHVKGRSHDFTAPTLDIRRDRGSYCRFKLEQERQLQDAIKVILTSASRSEGR
jgi:hypothetical protein